MTQIQIGSFRMRDPLTRTLGASQPILKTVQDIKMKNGLTKIENYIINKNAKILFELYNDHTQKQKATVENETGDLSLPIQTSMQINVSGF